MLCISSYNSYNIPPGKVLAISSLSLFEKCGKTYQELTDNYIQSLQQPKEIKVEIEMETKKQLINGYKNQPDNIIGFISEYKEVRVPKLNENGCIILIKK